MRQTKKKILILYSSGLDSYIMYHYAKKTNSGAEVVAVYFEHGQPAMWKEIERLPSFVVRKKLDWLDENTLPVPMKSKPNEGAIFIPGRNLVFIALAACQFLPDEVWMGSVANEVSPASTDKNAPFVEKTTHLLQYVLKDFLNDSIKVRIPFVENGWGKRECIAWALENGMSKDDILNTTSCYHKTDLACGNCVQCLRRWALFQDFGIEEQYKVHPLRSEYALETFRLLVKERKADFYYDEIVPAAKKFIKENPGFASEEMEQLINAVKE